MAPPNQTTPRATNPVAASGSGVPTSVPGSLAADDASAAALAAAAVAAAAAADLPPAAVEVGSDWPDFDDEGDDISELVEFAAPLLPPSRVALLRETHEKYKREKIAAAAAAAAAGTPPSSSSSSSSSSTAAAAKKKKKKNKGKAPASSSSSSSAPTALSAFVKIVGRDMMPMFRSHQRKARAAGARRAREERARQLSQQTAQSRSEALASIPEFEAALAIQGMINSLFHAQVARDVDDGHGIPFERRKWGVDAAAAAALPPLRLPAAGDRNHLKDLLSHSSSFLNYAARLLSPEKLEHVRRHLDRGRELEASWRASPSSTSNTGGGVGVGGDGGGGVGGGGVAGKGEERRWWNELSDKLSAADIVAMMRFRDAACKRVRLVDEEWDRREAAAAAAEAAVGSLSLGK